MAIGEWEIISELYTTNFADEIYDFFEPEYFENKICQEFYKILLDEHEHGIKHDIITGVEKLIESGFSRETAEKCARNIADVDTRAVELVQCAKTLAGKYQAKRVQKILTSEQITGTNVFEVIDRIQTELQSIKAPIQNGMNLGDMVDAFSNLYFCERPPYKFKTNFTELDKFAKLEPGDLGIIAACSGTGKSALALNIAVNMAFNGTRVVYFNLEMSEKSMFERIITRLMEIEMNDFRGATATSKDNLEKFEKAKARMKEKADKFTLYTGSYTCAQIRQIIRKAKPEIVFIDYLQLVTPSERYRGNKTAEVSEISRTIKNMATQFKIPIVGLSQFHRISDYEEPVKTDLRESGSLENDSSLILLMWKTDKENDEERCLKIEKNRNGCTKRFKFHFNSSLMEFTEDGEFRKATKKEQKAIEGKDEDKPDIFKTGA